MLRKIATSLFVLLVVGCCTCREYSSMTNAEIREQVCLESGRTNLFTAVGGVLDFTLPCKADYYIDTAIKDISDKVPELLAKKNFLLTLTPGQFQVNLPRIRVINYVYLYNADGNRQFLDPKDTVWLLDNFRKPFVDEDRGTPWFWARNREVLSEELVPANTVREGLPSWAYTAPEWLVLGDYFQEVDNGVRDLVLALGYTTGVVTITITFGTLVEDHYVQIWQFLDPLDMMPDPEDMTLEDIITEAGTYTYNISTNNTLLVIAIEPTGPLPLRSCTITNFSVRHSYPDLLIMPPSDTAYEMTVNGDFYFPPLVAWDDSNWITEHHADTVVKGAVAKIAAAFGGMLTERRLAYDESLKELEFDVVEQGMSKYEDKDGGLVWR